MSFSAVPRRCAIGRPRATISCLLLLAALVCTAPVVAETVAILRPRSAAPGLRETIFRLKGELLSVGLDVEVVERPASSESGEPELRVSLSQMAAERGLDAIIDVVGKSAPVAVEIWVFEPTPNQSEFSRVVAEPDRENADEELAIRAIDVLRSRLLEIDLGRKREKPRARTPAAPQWTPPAEARPVERVGVAAGAVVLISLDGVGPAVLPLLRFDFALHSLFSVQTTLAALGSRPSVAGQGGQARVSQEYALVGACYCLRSQFGLTPFAALAAGGLRTSLEGSATPPATAHSTEQWSVVLEASIGARWRLPGPFFLTLASHAHLATPYVAIHIVDSEVASAGRPNLLFALTAGAWL